MAHKGRKEFNRYPEHKPWCKEGVLESHALDGAGKHFFCVTCEGGKCPVCFPDYFKDRRRGKIPL